MDSVIKQTLKELEILCIDDGSTDGSYNILQRYAEKHKFIRIFKQKNNGAGAARNVGLQNAAGEYVAFLDADDYYLDIDALEKMYSACIINGVSLCGSYGSILEREKLRKANFYDVSKMKTGIILSYKDFQIDCGFTTFIYKKQLLDENDIRFPLYRRFEDPPFFVKAMYFAQLFVMADTSLYCYRSPNLVSRFTQNNLIDMLNGLQDNIRFAIEHNLKKLFYITINRLEGDYTYIILYNLSVMESYENSAIFICLLEINGLAQSYLDDKMYVLRPLKMMMTRAAFFSENYEHNLNEKIERLSYIAVYGAGKYAKNFLHYLQSEGKLSKVKYIVVTDTKENEENIEGIPVVGVESFINMKEDLCVFVAVSGMYHQEISNVFNHMKYTNFELLDDAFLGKIGRG